VKVECDEILEIVAKEKGVEPEDLQITLDHDGMVFYIESVLD
jgi:septum formation topological specificity factor MinE